MFELPDNSNILIEIIKGPNWFIKIPNLEAINDFNKEMIRKREEKEIRQLFKKKCQVTNINYYGSNNKGRTFPLIECYTYCNYCGKEIKIKYLDVDKINNKEKIISYCNLQCCNKVNIQIMQQYWKDHPEENCKGFKNLKLKDPEKAKQISINNCKKMNQFLIENPEIKQKNIEKLQEGSKKWRDENYDEFIKIISNNIHAFPVFKNENNIIYFYDKNVKDYVLWEDFKVKFSKQVIDFKLPEKFKIHTTFRTQDSENWIGAKAAFEQSLIDENISWFVYIKFDENNNPLVVGKSGSLLVNSNGSDISFSEDVKDGPARRFLIDKGITWNKTLIAIHKCSSEDEALKLEKEIQIQYNLFGS